MEVNRSMQENNLPIGAGKSTFTYIESEALFAFLPLYETTRFLDIACGNGAYTLAVAEKIGPKGRVFALDLWEEGIGLLREEAAVRGIDNVQSVVGDATQKFPLDLSDIDVCFMSSVLHDFVHIQGAEAVLENCVDVLRPNGTLVVVEFKKIDGPPGPPLRSRMTPEEVEKLVTTYGFRKECESEIGPCHYAMRFRLLNSD
ncbi:ubiquinone/menaquinone biosynthesis methyltransferase UbiE [candidate division KSB3 bacterium]|nr:MAG: ubiquinone/menaquinone biosynthesis methyltransferase UbiE [candidate division KSB3 bacterium]